MISLKMDEKPKHVREVHLSMTLAYEFQLLPRKEMFHAYGRYPLMHARRYDAPSR